MNLSSVALERIRRPLAGSGLWLALIALLLSCLIIAYEGYSIAQAVQGSAMAAARAQGNATAREITGVIAREQQRLRAFVVEKSAEIRQLLAAPEDWATIKALQTSLRRMFPDLIAFTVTDNTGQPLFEDFEGLIGPQCQDEMRRFSAASRAGGDAPAIPPIHPVPGAYHFDLISPLLRDDGSTGLFFVSLSPHRLGDMLAAAELASGDRLLLVNRYDPRLIEIAASGGRDTLDGDFRLNAATLAGPHFLTDLPGTAWRLLVLPDHAAISQQVNHIYVKVAVLIVGLLAVSAVLLWLIRRAEQRNSGVFLRSLQASVNRQRAILQSMVDGLVTIDAGGVIHDVNNAVTRLFGYQPNELIGQNVSMLMPDPDRTRHDRYMENYARTGEGKIIGRGREVLAQRKDGTVFPVLLTMGESFEGDQRMFVGILHDMTAHNAAQRQIVAQALEIERSHQELDEIGRIAMTALQPRLARMATFGDSMDSTAGSLDGRAHPHLKSLSDQARDVSDLVRGLADYARKEQSGEPVAIDLAAAVSAVRDDLAERLEAADAEVEIDAPGRVLGNPTQLHQVFWNLFDNALKFRDPQRPLRLTVSAQADPGDAARVQVVVEDNGVGIAADAAQHVFEGFYRVDPDDPRSGVGVGLALCRRIVEGAGGRISVDSRPGAGSRFIVTLPVAP